MTGSQIGPAFWLPTPEGWPVLCGGDMTNLLLTEAEQNRIIAELVTATEAEPGPDPQGLDPEAFSPGERRLFVRSVRTGRKAQDALADLSPDLLQAIWAANPDQPQAASLKTISAHTILTTVWPEPVWAIPQLLPVGLSILGGKPKVGKSWLALQVAQAVATGGRTLERQVDSGPVLYLALEDTPRRLQDRMRKQEWSANQAGDADFMTMGDFQEQIGHLGTPEGAARLIEQMHARQYRLVVIDTLSRAFRGDQNDADAMTRVLSPLQAAALALNCVVLVVDHHRKSKMGDSDPIIDNSGSVSKTGTADCAWGLYKEQGKSGAILHVLGRDVDEKRLKLFHDPLTGCWQVEGDADRLLSDKEQEVFDILQDLGGQCQLMDVVLALNLPAEEKGNVHNRLQELVNKGLVQRSKDGRAVYYEVL
jgi:hypothetical protein